ncbi:hypothetical protein AVEN_266134-1 [Araneus ventricosus]|uniref:Uncharacterized protein n=1 Tax=Araneus ventricosus TaxID=182803 RepID=A0A4Y2G8V0_ARAVE|nr:hypothetical protein AVEN_266134-1 [Araneus ventricosus]
MCLRIRSVPPMVRGKCPPARLEQKLGEVSSGPGAVLDILPRFIINPNPGPSQNSPRVASNWNVNITTLNFLIFVLPKFLYANWYFEKEQEHDVIDNGS